ncbi:hypothetical protein [Microbacterium sp. W4I20]|uniref:hypothetical protein n=1 Tax=Microbacterium sp. W4I20 TaxID=3042262 RepID=UPI00278966EF|nr:hypothetical protein [Microbacterium sp. W4I20]MDQ0726816.1 DNA-binding transcriptional MocR family regulator [Microbacterium sp. W4I20]
MTDPIAPEAPVAVEAGEQPQDKTFTQAELNQILKDRLAQQAKNQFGDYADLKAKAEGAKTVEQKLIDLEAKHAEAEARALRSEIATRHGITAEDRDLFLTGSNADALEAQAKRLAERIADQKKTGNVAPKEGVNKTTGDPDKGLREFARGLFGSTD